MNKDKQLRDIIIKAVPEIMELDEGCMFNWNYDIWTINCVKCEEDKIFAFSCTGDNHSLPMVTGEDVWNYKYKRFSKHEMKDSTIIGRPITLADVLICLRKTGILFGGSNDSFCKDKGGEITWLDNHWNLKEPLSGQSEKTIQFLTDILL